MFNNNNFQAINVWVDTFYDTLTYDYIYTILMKIKILVFDNFLLKPVKSYLISPHSTRFYIV